MGSLALIGTAAAAACLLAPRPARACGGTFCDGGLPTPMPIDQTGENVLFIVDGPHVEAHIQINIDSNTDADKFGWIIPVASVPDFSVGSNPLFNSLLAATGPVYTTYTTNWCDADDGEGGAGGGIFIANPDGGGASFEPELEEVVGALEVAVLGDGTAEQMVQWLEDNGYAQDDSAMPIIEEYIAQGWMFAAVKLANQVGVDEIHPLVMTYENGEPCVPLRLTRIAAKDDMEVRTFFLGEERVAPTNYKHVLVNPLKVDWLSQGDNYKEVVTLAVDAEGADGKAFVTEYAGDSSLVNQLGIWDPAWDPDVFMRADPLAVIPLLNEQGLTFCQPGFCGVQHPLLLPLLRKYLPAPEDVDEQDFWANMAAYEAQIDTAAWDGIEFSAELRERIVEPGFHAVELLDTWPYLTRLYTTISPGEMTTDPIFHPHPSLPEVPAFHQATREYQCEEGGSVVTLPDGREVWVSDYASWPDFGDEMPWVEDVEEVMAGGGAPMPVVDNTELIDQLLAEYNAAHMPKGMDGTGGTDGGTDAAGEDSGTAGPDFPTGDGGADGSSIDNVSSGCACQTGRGWGGGIGFGLGLLLAGLITRRRRT